MAASATVNNTNRISRRKSSTFSQAANAAAIGAAVESAVAEGSLPVYRRGSVSKAIPDSLIGTSHLSTPSSLPHGATIAEGNSDAIVDGPPLSSYTETQKLKMRRASDGARLTKKEKAATGELKCEHCGKGYKHGSCLTKHLYVPPGWIRGVSDS